MVGLSCAGPRVDPVGPLQLRIHNDPRETSTTYVPLLRNDVSSSTAFYLCQLGARKWVSSSEIYSFALMRTVPEVPCFSCFPDFQARPPGGQNTSEKQDERISSPSAVPSVRHRLGSQWGSRGADQRARCRPPGHGSAPRAGGGGLKEGRSSKPASGGGPGGAGSCPEPRGAAAAPTAPECAERPERGPDPARPGPAR